MALSRRLPSNRPKLAERFRWTTQVGHLIDQALDRIESVTQGHPQLHQETHLQGGLDPHPAPGTPTTLDPNLAGAVGTGTTYALEDHRHPLDLKLTTKGDSLTRDASGYAREAVGANETLHVADSAQTTGRRWATLVSLLGAILTTKGDILIRNTTTVARKGVGANGLPLVADSADGDGLRYGPKVLRPAQITASQNDYAPGQCSILFLNSDAAWNITGLVAGTVDGEDRMVVNNGAFDITLKHENVASAAANRFTGQGSADVSLKGGFMARLVYDLTATRWRAAAL